MVNARAAARGEYYDLSILPMDAVEFSHPLADLFEEISPDVRLRVALLWPCLIEAFDFCFAATHD
jgi:hypothetical protein